MPILFIAVQAQEKAICFFLCLESILYSLKGQFIPAPKGTGFSGPMDYKPASPFKPLTVADVLNDLETSRSQIANGEGMNMKDALQKMGKRHGFI